MATKKNSWSKPAMKSEKTCQATLRLDSAFYPLPALERGKEAFSQLAQIDIQTGGREAEIRFSGMKADVAALLPDEYANFVLACTVTEP
jgi:hypothetical protein